MIKSLIILISISLLCSSVYAKSKTQWLPIFNDGLIILVPFKKPNSTADILFPLKKTGQKISYDGKGNVISDGSVKDDGYYQKGVVPSYSRSFEVVTDHITRLQWSDTENVSLDNWDESHNYCSELILNGQGWRLPSMEELDSIILPSVHRPAMDTSVFKNYNTGTYGDYWTSTVGIGSTDRMWRLHLYKGNRFPSYKHHGAYGRCVRLTNSKPLTHFRRAGDIVLDSATGLQWQDTEEVYAGNWQPAIDYCESLNLNGKGWRLPNINELKSIIDYKRNRPSINPIFKNAITNYDEYFNYFWSSTTSSTRTDNALIIDFGLGELRSNDKTFSRTNSVRCVR